MRKATSSQRSKDIDVLAAVVAEKVSVGNGGGSEILHDLSFSFQAGNIHGVIGPNGAGKTTLLRTLLGAIEYSGRISLDGKNLRSLSPRARARICSYVPQKVTPPASIRVLEFLRLSRLPFLSWSKRLGAEDELIVGEAIETFKLGNLLSRPARSLSGGEQQRMLIAAACIQTPKILLLDEPSSNLDPFYTAELLHTLLARQEGMTVLFVTHDLLLAWSLADSLLALSEGEIVGLGKPSQLQESGVIEHLFGQNVSLLSDADGRSYPVPSAFLRRRRK